MKKGATKTHLSVGCLNVRSLCNKVTGAIELLKDNSIDICCMTETWLKLKDDAIFAEIHEQHYDIISAPRKGRGGGVAFIFNPNIVKIKRNNVKKYKSFEALECVTSSSTKLVRFISL